ncbi:MAG: hypothetical protein AAB489_04830 [Patescibacteria group bacterium]
MDLTNSSRTKLLTYLVIIALVALVVALDLRRRAVEDQLQKLSVSVDQVTGNREQNREDARKVVESVKKIFLIPAGVEPTVATIVDVEALKSRNPFYKNAQNGDYLLVTADRAILFDADKNLILDVAPVQIQPAAPAAPGQQ